MRLYTTAFLVALYGTLSFLGHGGLHAVEGTDTCCGHSHAHPGSDGCCQHSHASHGHSHSHCPTAHQESSGNEPSPEPPPPHDHDNCLICQWHAQGKISVDAPANVSIDVPCLDTVQVDASTPGHVVTCPALARGPPLCA